MLMLLREDMVLGESFGRALQQHRHVKEATAAALVVVK
jgi:hypothetical protein